MKRVFKTKIKQSRLIPFISGKKVLGFIAIICLSVGMVKAQEVHVENADEVSIDKNRQHAREKLSMFLEYCYVIADKRTDKDAKTKYIQAALNLFLPNESYIVISKASGIEGRELKMTTNKFLEKISKGFYVGDLVVSEYEYYHIHKLRPISDENVKVELCFHKDNLKNLYDDSECIFKDYKQCVLPIRIFEKEELGKITFLTTIRVTFNKE